jgi:hypothetical protein
MSELTELGILTREQARELAKVPRRAVEPFRDASELPPTAEIADQQRIAKRIGRTFEYEGDPPLSFYDDPSTRR